MLIPEACGGVGASCFEEALVSEELGYGCTGISTSLGVNSLAMLPILIAGSDEQKAYWLGERAGDQGQFCSYGVTEANAGSNVAAFKRARTSAARAYIINGEQDLHHQRQLRSFLHDIRQDRSGAGHRGMTCFIVDRDSRSECRQEIRQAGSAGFGYRRDRIRQCRSAGGEYCRRGRAGLLHRDEGLSIISRPGRGGRRGVACSGARWKKASNMPGSAKPLACRFISIRRSATRSLIWRSTTKRRGC